MFLWGEKEMDDYEEFEELDFVQPHKKIPVNLVVDNWIPCSKKVPEEKGMYLTTTIDKEVYCDYWNGVNFDRTELVIAWRPLPLPYEGDSGVKRNDCYDNYYSLISYSRRK